MGHTLKNNVVDLATYRDQHKEQQNRAVGHAASTELETAIALLIMRLREMGSDSAHQRNDDCCVIKIS